ncbi:tetratricopeptide repeat protein, partial [Planctomycetota bacterium]
FKDQPLVKASIQHTLGWTYKELGEQTKAEQHLEDAMRLYEEQLGEDHRQTLGRMHDLGWVYLAQNRLDDAHRILTRARQIIRRTHGKEDAVNNALGCLYSRMGRYKEAEALFLKNVGIDWRERGKDYVPGYSAMNLARVYFHQGRYEEAERLFLKLPGISKAENPGKLQYTAKLADVYTAQGRYEDAEQLYKTSLEKCREALGEEHHLTVGSMAGLARLYTKQGRYPEAERSFKEVWEGRKLELGPEHPHTIESLNQLIKLYEAWGKPEKAEEWREKLPQTEAVEQ